MSLLHRSVQKSKIISVTSCLFRFFFNVCSYFFVIYFCFETAFTNYICFQMPTSTFQQDGSSFRRKLSKREKKQLKKQEKLNRLKSGGVNDENDARVAEKLYSGYCRFFGVCHSRFSHSNIFMHIFYFRIQSINYCEKNMISLLQGDVRVVRSFIILFYFFFTLLCK